LQFHSLDFHSWHSVHKNNFYPLFSLQQKRSPCWIAAQSVPTHPMRPSPPINHSLPCIQYTHTKAHAGAHMHRHTGSLITLIFIHPQDGTCTVCWNNNYKTKSEKTIQLAALNETTFWK
jgi:hypothetical protein